ncbi:MAG: DUF2290 domain-containing protein [Xenococcus sp. (in: cyanobacteria)]
MINAQSVLKYIKNLTSQLISVGLLDVFNFPSLKTVSQNRTYISHFGSSDLSIALKNIAYQEIYDELDKNKNYNIKLIDGALIQLLYKFQGSKLLSHRLAFFPSPYLESFQNEPEIYEEDEFYADIIAKNIVAVPIRFDYDPDNFQEIHHPRCHLTLGQFKNCRIPVLAPLTPSIFMAFILRHFYNTAYHKYSEQLKFNDDRFEESITKLEKRYYIFLLINAFGC